LPETRKQASTSVFLSRSAGLVVARHPLPLPLSTALTVGSALGAEADICRADFKRSNLVVAASGTAMQARLQSIPLSRCACA